MVADLLAARAGLRFKRDRSRSQVAAGRLAGLPVLLAKPQSFMNLSGGPVAALARYHAVPPGRLVVIHDELDLPFGAIRLKFGGGNNGHNGLKSVSGALGTRDYYRIRLGIGRPAGLMSAADYVLHDFTAAERGQLPELLGRAADAVERLLRLGLAAAQNEFHPADGAAPAEPAP